MNQNIKIVLTGGGTAGHVMPHLAMLPLYEKHGWQVHYLGSNGIEKKLAENENGVVFHQISSGKLRRYFSWQNFADIFKVFWGFLQSIYILLKIRPYCVFSKGGFVSVPVAWAAKLLGVRLYTHESDLTPGLATKLIAPIADRVFCAFGTTTKYLSKYPCSVVGIPVRSGLQLGSAVHGAELCNFKLGTPTLLVMGGSLGAQRLNEALLAALPLLVDKMQIVHLTGIGKKIDFEHPHYRGFEYCGEELAHLLALADCVVSRAGANSIFEFLALNKPMLLIPLELGSRGDQVHNAEYFVEQGFAMVLRESSLDDKTLLSEIDQLFSRKDELKLAQKNNSLEVAASEKIFSEIS